MAIFSRQFECGQHVLELNRLLLCESWTVPCHLSSGSVNWPWLFSIYLCLYTCNHKSCLAGRSQCRVKVSNFKPFRPWVLLIEQYAIHCYWINGVLVIKMLRCLICLLIYTKTCSQRHGDRKHTFRAQDCICRCNKNLDGSTSAKLMFVNLATTHFLNPFHFAAYWGDWRNGWHGQSCCWGDSQTSYRRVCSPKTSQDWLW